MAVFETLKEGLSCNLKGSASEDATLRKRLNEEPGMNLCRLCGCDTREYEEGVPHDHPAACRNRELCNSEARCRGVAAHCRVNGHCYLIWACQSCNMQGCKLDLLFPTRAIPLDCNGKQCATCHQVRN